MWTKIDTFLNAYFENECEEDVGIKSFFEAMKCGENQEYEKALELYKIALKYGPNSDAIYNNMGNVYVSLKDYDQALIHYKQALLLDSKSPNVHQHIGWVYYEQENYQEALSWYLESEKINMPNGFIYIDIANCYYNMQEYDKAIDNYQKALELDLNNDYVLSMLGTIFHHMKKYNKAIDYYVKAYQINDKNIAVLSKLSICYFRVKVFEKSIEFGLKWLEEDKDNHSPYVNILEARLMLNKPFIKNLEEAFIEKFSDNKESMILYSHLKILEEIMLGKEVNLEEWKVTYKGVSFNDWEFEALDSWAMNQEDLEIREKLLEALVCFKEKDND